MRATPLIAFVVAAAAAGSSTACSSDKTPSATPTSAASNPSAPTTSADEDPGQAGSADAALQSVINDVEAYAPSLEQVYFANGYPKDLTGALDTARQLTNLSLSPGNSIAGYAYDTGDREFRLCVENTSGAYAIYDTSPMTTTESGRSGGCAL